MGKTISTVIVIVIIVIVALLLFGGGDKSTELLPGEGRVVFSVTNKAADLEGVREISLAVDNVELFSKEIGWVQADMSGNEFDLLTLKGQGIWEHLATMTTDARTFSRIRLNIDDVHIEFDDGNRAPAELISKSIEVEGIVRVLEGATTSVNFDILASESLHGAVGGEYIFAPVIIIESRSDVEVTLEEDLVDARAGVVDETITLGVDIDGAARKNFRLNPQSRFMIIDGKVLPATEEEFDFEGAFSFDQDETVSPVEEDRGEDAAAIKGVIEEDFDVQ